MREIRHRSESTPRVDLALARSKSKGVAFHGNDWMADDSPAHVRQITQLKMTSQNELLVAGKLADGTPVSLRISLDGKLKIEPPPTGAENPGADFLAANQPEKTLPATGQRLMVRAGKIVADGEGDGAGTAGALQNPVDSTPGKDGSLWVIDQTTDGTEVKQFSAKGEALRRLAIPAGDPAPKRIAASTDKDMIALLESSAGMQRVRALALDTAADPASGGAALSTWKTLYSKTILASDTFPASATNWDVTSRSSRKRNFAFGSCPIRSSKMPCTTSMCAWRWMRRGRAWSRRTACLSAGSPKRQTCSGR